MGKHHHSGMSTWRAGCTGTCTSGSEGGPQKPTDRKTGRALRPDPYTEIQCWDGKLYLATVIDLWSRRLIGFAIAEHCKAGLVCQAMRMAVATRGGHVAGVRFHSDRGSQYTAGSFTALCARHGIVQSMSRAGSCHDNAAAESWFATLKTELVYRIALSSKAFARHRLIAWIDRYNRTRRHSHCGLKSPITYETINTPAANAA